MKNRTQVKQLLIIHADEDAADVQKLEKVLLPWTANGRLNIWRQDQALPGHDKAAAYQMALEQADLVAVWVSPAIWEKQQDLNTLEQFFLGVKPGQTTLCPILGRQTAAWETHDIFSGFTQNVLPANRQPMPTQEKDRQDAWLSGVASGLLERLGLVTPRQHRLVALWSRLGLGERISIGLAAISIFITLIYGAFQLYLAYPSYQADKNQLELTGAPTRPIDDGAFPKTFVKDSLYVLITRFEDDKNLHDTKCYGTGIEWHINQLVRDKRLPIRTSYRDDLSPNTDFQAESYRKQSRADLIIWGKLRNAGADCRSDGFCLQFTPSDTLIKFAGGFLEKPELDSFQRDKSNEDLQMGLVSMGEESFDQWLMGMSNLKIGARKPEFYVIEDSWPVAKQAEAYRIRGEVWLSVGLYEKAMADFKKVAAIAPQSSDAYRQLGSSQINLKNYLAAIPYLDTALIYDPSNINLYFLRGRAKLLAFKRDAAIADFDKALALDPNNINSLVQRAGIYKEMGFFEKAIQLYDQAIAANPKRSDLWIKRAYCNAYLRSYSTAIQDCERGIQISDAPNLHIAKAEIHRRQGAIKKSLAEIALVKKMGKQNDELYAITAGIYKKQKKFSDALVQIDSAILLNKYNFDNYYLRALIYSDLGRNDKAIADFNKALELINRPDPAILAMRGATKADMGLYKDAIADCNMAMYLSPGHPAVYHTRAYCYRLQGRYDLALLDLFQEFRLAPTRFWYIIFVPLGLYALWRYYKFRKRKV